MAAAQMRHTGQERARITRRDNRTGGAHRSPANKLQTPRTGGGGRTPTRCNRERYNTHGREAESTKKIYLHTAKQARFFDRVRIEGIRPRTAPGVGSGSAARTVQLEPAEEVRANFPAHGFAHGARTPGRLVESEMNGGGEKCAFSCQEAAAKLLFTTK